MRLRSVSRGFFAAVLLALAANLGFLLVIRHAEGSVHAAFEARDRTLGLVTQLEHENDQLAQLVQSFTTTAETRYLTRYYEILAGREGDPSVAAGAMPPQSLIQRMQALEFTPVELGVARGLLETAGNMQAIEKIAFAATQGLYDRAREDFISDGTPERDYAIALVHSPAYERQRAALQAAVVRLSGLARARTEGDVARMRDRLNLSINAAILVDLAMLPLLAAALFVLRRRVLTPITHLVRTARSFSAGEFNGRTAEDSQRVQELGVLAKALDEMAAAIERDLQRRDADQRELQAAHDAAEAATLAKSRFLANMSHEIRTPMNAIMGMTYLALQTGLTPEQRDYLDKAHGASRMLLGLINDVLDFSKIEAGRMTLEQAPFSLESVVAQALELVRRPAQAKELELVCDYTDASLLANRGTLRGDALRLQQVLVNLLANAVKFTPAGQVRLIVGSDDSAPDDGHVALRLVVQDTGIGMDETQVRSLFREFTQADASTTRRFGGTGLGLAITQRLVHLMGGTTAVASTPGGGSRFEVTLVLPTEAAVAPPDCCPAAATARVLVIDGQPDTLNAVLGQLHTLGIGAQGRLAGARGAEQALQQQAEALARGEPFDRVLLDWVLPDGEGAAVLAQLRERQPDLRVAVVSAYGSAEVRAQARGGGATDFIPKPVLPEDLRRQFRAAPDTAQQPAAGARLDGLRALLVEDNALNQELAVEVLRRRGAHVEVAGNGLEALELLGVRGPAAFDVVLMDLQMPVLDGIEATRRLRAKRGFEQLPVLAVTAHALADERERCAAVGMQGHIAKPLDIVQLVATLQPYCRATTRTQPMASPPPAQPLPPMPALDVALALRRFDGQVGLYRHTLRSFAKDYGDGIGAWQALLARRDFQELRRFAHTLHGLAATIGATVLATMAGALEHAAAQRDAVSAGATFAPLATRLAEVVAQIDAALEPPPPWLAGGARAPEDAAPTIDPEQGLATLRDLLAAADSQALDWWQAHQATLRAALPAGAARRLAQAMNVLDFDAALASLPEVTA